MKRRTGLVAAGAVVAIGAGAGTAWWRSMKAPAMASAQAPASAATAESRFWAMSFAGVDGEPVRIGSFRGKPLLLNFWATWCAPCVAEMPLLDAFGDRTSATGWQVLAIAVDSAEAVRQFLALHRLDLPVALAGANGLQLSRDLGNSFGGLPFTAVFDATGRLAHHHVGAVDSVMLETWLETT